MMRVDRFEVSIELFNGSLVGAIAQDPAKVRVTVFLLWMLLTPLLQNGQ